MAQKFQGFTQALHATLPTWIEKLLCKSEKPSIYRLVERWWKLGLRILVWGCLAVALGLGVMSTKQTLSYSSVCTRCLATRSGVERSILGISYQEKHRSILHLYDTTQKTRPEKLSQGKQPIYEKIHGAACEHDFARMGFCRYRSGTIGCGASGRSSEVITRNELVSSTFATFERIADKELAVRSCELIEQEFPMERPPRNNGQNLIEEAAADRERYRQMSLLGDMLNLVRNKEDWAKVLDYGKGDFQGDPPLLNDPAGLSERLRSGDLILRRTAASALAREPSTDEELMKEMLRHADEEVVKSASQNVFYGKLFPLFGASLRSLPFDEYQKKSMQSYTKEEFEALFAMNDSLLDIACLEAISKGDRFELLEIAFAALNRDPSETGSNAVKRLLRGPDPFFENLDLNSDEMWNDIETIHAPIEELRVSIRTDVGPNRLERSKYSLTSAIKSVGATHDVSQWSFLRDSYQKAIARGISPWWLACMAKAMHELDASATEALLIAEIKGSNDERVSAAFSSMGLIAAHNFEKSLDEFVAHPPESSSNEDNPPKYYFFGDGYGARFLKYALHRCRGIHSWKLVKNAEGKYVVEKPDEVR